MRIMADASIHSVSETRCNLVLIRLMKNLETFHLITEDFNNKNFDAILFKKYMKILLCYSIHKLHRNNTLWIFVMKINV